MADDPNKPKIDWIGHIRYTILMVVAVVVALMLMRYFGLRS